MNDFLMRGVFKKKGERALGNLHHTTLQVGSRDLYMIFLFFFHTKGCFNPLE
jgi:hypothetical protein